MTDEKVVKFIRAWYEKSEPDGLFEQSKLFLPQNQDKRIIPYLGIKSGQDQINKAFDLRNEAIDIEKYEIREIIEVPGKICTLVFARYICKSTSAAFERLESHLLTIDDNERVKTWIINFDTAPETAAFTAGIDKKLLDAVKNSDLEQVKKLLEAGADPDVREAKTGFNVLMMASGQGDVEIVKILLEYGADVHTTDASLGGATALHKACHSDSFEIFKLLADAGSSVEALATSTAHTPLFEAIWFKCVEVVDYLLEKNVGLNLVTRYGLDLKMHFDETSALNIRGKEKLAKIGEMIEKRRKSDDEQVKNQKIMAATIDNDIDTVKSLLESGESVDERFPVVNGPNDRHSPLLVACREGRTEIVELLINAGADVNAVEPTFGAVPLHKAVYNGHERITQMLVDQPGIDLDFQGATNRYTPLHDAIWHGFDKCAEILVNAGARLDLTGDDGKIPLELSKEVFGTNHELTKLIESKMS